MKNMCLVIFLLAGLLVDSQGWDNLYDEHLNFTCPLHESIFTITSKHNNRREDRVWDFNCKRSFGTRPSQCFWSPYVNWFDRRFSYSCPENHIISGMESYHSNRAEDRRWKFYCCRSEGVCNHHCYWTPYVNNFDEQFTYYVPHLNYLAGVGSYHANRQEDRRWKYLHCARRPCFDSAGSSQKNTTDIPFPIIWATMIPITPTYQKVGRVVFRPGRRGVLTTPTKLLKFPRK